MGAWMEATCICGPEERGDESGKAPADAAPIAVDEAAEANDGRVGIAPAAAPLGLGVTCGGRAGARAATVAGFASGKDATAGTPETGTALAESTEPVATELFPGIVRLGGDALGDREATTPARRSAYTAS